MDSIQSSTSFKPQLKQPQSNLYLSDRLVGQDKRLDHISNLFEQLQLATVETCDPTLDLLTFAETACFFAVIMKKKSVIEEEKPWVSEPKNQNQSNKRQIPTLSHGQVGVSEENMPNIKEKSFKAFFGLRSPQKRNRYDRTVDVHPEAQASQNLWSDYNNTQFTSKADLIDLHHDLPPDGQRVPEWHETEGFYADIDIPQEEAIGLVYLVDLASLTDDPLRAQELNIGIILEPFHRGKGYAHQVIEMVLEVAFETAKCHRVQAILPDHVAKDRAICLFTQMRFDHEGTRRRAFFSPMEHVYKDVTYMGMLDTDWMLRQTDRQRAQRSGRPAPKSVWDELLSRHQREREELLNWEAGIRDSGTLRARVRTPTQSNFRMTKANDDDDDEMADETDSDVAFASNKSELKEEETGWKTLPRGHESDPFATSSDSESDSISERSASLGGYFSVASSSGSAWDVVESSDLDSSSSSSNFGDEEAFEVIRGTSQST